MIRNPQTFVPNIFFAKPGDYKKATERHLLAWKGQASFVKAAGGGGGAVEEERMGG